MEVKKGVKLGVKKEVKKEVKKGAKVVLALLMLFGQCSLFNVHCSMALAQPVATPLTAGHTPEGIVYFLPKTVFRFHVKIERRISEPGVFARYASRYLQLNNVLQERDVDHNIIGMEVTQMGVRDTSKCYALKLKGGKCETADIRLSDDGVLLAVNDEPIALAEPTLNALIPKSAPTVINDPTRYLDADTRSAGSVAKMAELTARQMAELNEKREALITGDADEIPQDDAQLQRMLGEIDKEYNALLSLFTGVVSRDTTEHVITYCPQEEVSRQVLFRISRQRGLVDADDLSGVPYYITVEDLYKTDTAKYPLTEPKKHEGLYANVPGHIRLTLHCDYHELKTFELPAAQFGFVELRDAQLLKRHVTHLQLHPATGAVVKCIADVENK